MNNSFMVDQSKRLFAMDKSRKRKEVFLFILTAVVFLSVMIVF